MSGFNPENLVGDLLKSGLGGRKKSRKRMKKGLRRAAFSPQGLTLLGGVAIAAFEHFSGRDQAQAAGSPAPGTPGAEPGAGRTNLPPTPGSPTQSVGRRVASPPAAPNAPAAPGRSNLPPLPGRSSGPAAPPPSAPGSPPSVDAGPPPSLPASNAPATPPPLAAPEAPGAGLDPGTGSVVDGNDRSRALLLAMTEAAKCDGVVSDEERSQILGELEVLGVGPEARAFMEQQLGTPLDVETLVQAVGGDATLAAQVFVASRVVIADASPAEEGYLALLAGRLGISADLAQQLRAHIDKALADREGEG